MSSVLSTKQYRAKEYKQVPARTKGDDVNWGSLIVDNTFAPF